MEWGLFLQKAGYLYPDIPRVATEITRVLSQYTTLFPKVDTFMSTDGKSHTLIKIIGTIPIYFRGNTYNIPVCLWLVQNFPSVAPLVFIQPNQDMLIKMGHANVNQNGRVTAPYLYSWSVTQSTLCGLLPELTKIFSREPPVFSKLQASPQQLAMIAQQQQQQQQPQFTMQNNNNIASSSSSFSFSPSQQQQQQQQQNHNNSEDPGRKKLYLADVATAKIQAKLREIHASLRPQLVELMTAQEQLKHSAKLIQTSSEALDMEYGVLQRVQAQIAQEKAATEDWLSDHEHDTLSDISTVTVFEDSLGKQLLQAVARDHAAEDAYFVFEQMWQNEQMELDQYLKTVRKMAREQFRDKALAYKILQEKEKRRIAKERKTKQQEQK